MRHPVVFFKDLLQERMPKGAIRTLLGKIGWALLGGRSSRRLVNRQINGQSLRLEAHTTLQSHEYERHVFDWIDRHLPTNGLLLDIGAHYGLISLPLLKKHPDRRAILVEANSANCRVIARHLEANGMSGRATVCHLAVSDTDGQTATFSLLDDETSCSGHLGPAHLPGLPSPAQTEMVNTVRVDTLLRRVGAEPDVVKIDIEGFEVRAVRSMSELMRRRRPHMIIALHHPWVAAIGDNMSELFAMLQECGYCIERFDVPGQNSSQWEEIKCYPG